jgi:hypothetical protein
MDVVRLREWGTERIHVLPQLPVQDCFVGTSTQCALRLTDPHVSPTHAELIFERNRWRIRGLGSAPALRLDGIPREDFDLVAGAEIGIGTTTLVAETPRTIALREFCARMLGWGSDRMKAVDHALRALRFAAARRSGLILCGQGDLVPIAHTLHRHTLGIDAPFIVCDPRRRNFSGTVRSPANHDSGVTALRAAAGGSLCVRGSRLPRDLSELLRLLHEPDSGAQFIVCLESEERPTSGMFLTVLLAGSMLIEVPSLGVRQAELLRIIDEYADEAITALHAPTACFTGDDRSWVVQRAAGSLPEIEKATRRVVALKISRGRLPRAAKLLGMAQVSLTQWFRRRAPFPVPTGPRHRERAGRATGRAVPPELAAQVAANDRAGRDTVCADLALGGAVELAAEDLRRGSRLHR